MKRALFVFAFSAVALAVASSANAALNAYLQLKGSKTARFNSASAGGWYDTFCPSAALTALTSPREPASGQATGKRQHMPLRMRMYYDQSTMQSLQKAFRSQEPIRTVTLLLHRPGKQSGKEELFMKITLEDARISSCRLGTMDGRAALYVELMFDLIKTQSFTKTVGTNSYMSDINFGNG